MAASDYFFFLKSESFESFGQVVDLLNIFSSCRNILTSGSMINLFNHFVQKHWLILEPSMNDSFRSKACKINWIIHSVIRSKTLIHLGTEHERFIESFTQVICSNRWFIQKHHYCVFVGMTVLLRLCLEIFYLTKQKQIKLLLIIWLKCKLQNINVLFDVQYKSSITLEVEYQYGWNYLWHRHLTITVIVIA